MHAFHPHWTCSSPYTACALAPTLTASTHPRSGLLPFSPFQLGTQRLCVHLLQDGQPGLTPMARIPGSLIRGNPILRLDMQRTFCNSTVNPHPLHNLLL